MRIGVRKAPSLTGYPRGMDAERKGPWGLFSRWPGRDGFVRGGRALGRPCLARTGRIGRVTVVEAAPASGKASLAPPDRGWQMGLNAEGGPSPSPGRGIFAPQKA